MDFILVRHGSTDWNIEKKIQGREDICLNEAGVRQCEECRDSLACIQFDKIISSPLKRAVKTAEIISGKQHIKHIEVMEEFIERDFGKWSGITVTVHEVLKLLKTNEGMEPVEEVQARALSGLLKLAADEKDKRVLIVTHGGVINALLKKIEGQSFVEKVLTNAGVTFLREAHGTIEYSEVFNSGDEFVQWYQNENEGLGHTVS